jgi:DNA-binding XRE family transcriptional regulator
MSYNIISMEDIMLCLDKLKYVREMPIISQEILAHDLGMNFGAYNRFENRKPKLNLLTRRSFMEFCKRIISTITGEEE